MTEESTLQYPGRWAVESPDRPAIVMTGSGQAMTFAELDAEANRISQLVRSLGSSRATMLPSVWRTASSSWP